jgi:hypothetical protein
MMKYTNPAFVRVSNTQPVIAGIALLMLFSSSALAQSATPAILTVSPDKRITSVHATHLIGFEDARSNATGTLTIHEDALQFQRNGKPAAEIKIASVQDIFLGGESKQIGGVPMAVGKAAVPFSGGRVVSLFAHKKYDTLSLEYVDANGGIHGAIFLVEKGQAALLKNELVVRGAHVSPSEVEPSKQNVPEVPSDGK